MHVSIRSCFLLLARFFVVFSVFVIYFYCFLMISICFSTDFMTFILKNPRNSMTTAKRPNAQTKPNQPIMAEDFRIPALRPRGLSFPWSFHYIDYICKVNDQRMQPHRRVAILEKKLKIDSFKRRCTT